MKISQLKGDLIGGITATLVPIPKAMALGALVFAPLGPEYMPMGLVAGLVSLAMSNIGGALIGGMPFMNNAPYSLSSFMLLGGVQLIIRTLGTAAHTPQGVAATMALLFFMVFVGGAFQLLFGLLKIGNFAKYIPYPVVAGLLNGSAILIVTSQLHLLLGIPKPLAWHTFLSQITATQSMTLLLALIVCLAIWAGPKISRKIPDPFYGIVAGTVAYYLFRLWVPAASLGPLIGRIPSAVPLPRYGLEFVRLISGGAYNGLLGDLSLMALGISAIVSLRSLVVCTAGETLTQERYNPNRELMSQGVGNMLVGLFGGITGAGSLPSTLANYQYGGRTDLSRVASGLFTLAVLICLHPLVARIPTVVLAGMLVMIACKSLDQWSLTLLPGVRPALAVKDNRPLINVLVVGLVTVTIIAFGIFEALGVGLMVTIALFVLQLSKTIIRRESSGAVIRSNTQRAERESALLEAHGERIRILELEGPLFFGTADKIAVRVEQLLGREAGFVIIDCKRVSEIDSTGAKIMSQLVSKCAKHGLELFFSSVIMTGANQAHRELRNILGAEQIRRLCFMDMEIALAVAEDRLLDTLIGRGRYDREIGVEEVDALAQISPAEFARVSPFFSRHLFANGETIVHQGESDQNLFFVLCGRTRVMLQLTDAAPLRLSTLCPGTVFGEMAILDQGPRSADVQAVGTVVCACLTRDALVQINASHPEVGYKILSGLGKELARRLRLSNRTVFNLKS
jgi:MFS superfamily sulfate permease-like transporter